MVVDTVPRGCFPEIEELLTDVIGADDLRNCSEDDQWDVKVQTRLGP